MHSNVSKMIFFIYLVMLHSACTLHMAMDDIYMMHTLNILVSSSLKLLVRICILAFCYRESEH